MTTAQRIPTEKIPRPDVALAVWFIEAVPMQHPFWWNYIFSLVSLADKPGFPPAIKTFAQATHEMHLVALDPSLKPVADNLKTWQHLYPINYARQIAVPNDEAAVEIAQQVVIGFMEGHALLEISDVMGGRRLNDTWVDVCIQRYNAKAGK